MAQGTTPPLLTATTFGDLRYSAPSQLQRCSNTHFTLHRLGLPMMPAGHAVRVSDAATQALPGVLGCRDGFSISARLLRQLLRFVIRCGSCIMPALSTARTARGNATVHLLAAAGRPLLVISPHLVDQ